MGKRVQAIGFVVTPERSAMGYRLDVWTAWEGVPERTTVRYGQLSFTELGDLLLVYADHHRPGTDVGEGWAQPILPLD